MAFCSFQSCCLIRGLRDYLTNGWDSNRQLLVNRPSNIHSVLSPLCRLHLTWQLPALQRILFQPQTSGPTQRRESPVFFFLFSEPTQLPAAATPDVLSRGETFKSQCCIKSFNYLIIFALSRWGLPKTGGLQCEPFRLCLLLLCRVTCAHCSLHGSEPGLTWLDSTGQAVFAIHHFMRNLS